MNYSVACLRTFLWELLRRFGESLELLEDVERNLSGDEVRGRDCGGEEGVLKGTRKCLKFEISWVRFVSSWMSHLILFLRYQKFSHIFYINTIQNIASHHKTRT